MNKQINKNSPTEDITVNDVVVKTIKKPEEISEEERLGLDKLQTPPVSGEETFSKDVKFTLDESLFEDVRGRRLTEANTDPRYYTNKVLDYVDGLVDGTAYDIILSLLKYMSDDDVEHWARINDFTFVFEDEEEDFEESFIVNESLTKASSADRRKLMEARLTEGQVRDIWFKVYDSLAPDTINKKIDKFPDVKMKDRYDPSDIEIYDSNAIGVMSPTKEGLSFAKRVADYFGLKSVVSSGHKHDKYPWRLRIIIPGVA